MIARADAPPEVADQFEATLVWMHDAPLLPGRPYLVKLGTQTVGATCATPEVQDRREHARASRGAHARAQRDRRVQPEPRPAGRVRPIRPQPPHGRLHRDRSRHQRHGRCRDAALRVSPRATCTGRRSTSTAPRVPRRRRRRRGSWLTGLSGAGKSTIANRACMHSASTRTCSTATTCGTGQSRSRLHRGRSRGEHPARRRSRAADARCGHHARVVHLAVPRGARHGARAGRQEAPSRYSSTRRSRSEERDPKGLYEGTARRAEALHGHRFAVRTTRAPRTARRHGRRVAGRSGRSDRRVPARERAA